MSETTIIGAFLISLNIIGLILQYILYRKTISVAFMIFYKLKTVIYNSNSTSSLTTFIDKG